MTDIPHRVIMVQPNLEGAPVILPPAGFKLRWYAPGDEEIWLRIHQLAEPCLEIGPELYTRQFGGNEALLRKRQVFLLHESGHPGGSAPILHGTSLSCVGTATAWFDSEFEGKEYGRVHWVAVVPEYQRRGLAGVLVGAVCERLRDLGHRRTYLVTWSDRPWAIRLYARFGFRVHRK